MSIFRSELLLLLVVPVVPEDLTWVSKPHVSVQSDALV